MRAADAQNSIGIKQVGIGEVEHNIVFYDEHMYSAHVNRGGIWGFDDGEIAVAHLVNSRCPYDHPKWVAHGYSMSSAGVFLHRSFDEGKTWPAAESKKWVWHNDRSTDEILDWLRPPGRRERQRIDMGAADSIMHFSYSHYMPARVQRPWRAFCLRSPDRGRTWEAHPSLLPGPDGGGGILVANLGHVRFANGVLGVAANAYDSDGRNRANFYTSHDDGLSWEFLSTIVAADQARSGGSGGDERPRFTYLGAHQLPDGRLLCSMHRIPGNLPCISFSADSGCNWSPPRPIVGPASYALELGGEQPEFPRGESAPGENHPGFQRYRSPVARVLRDGRILVLFGRRGVRAVGGNGIHGVVSDDLGQTWSKEFMVWGQGYATDGGYPVVTELRDGRIFTAYYATVKERDERIREYECVRHIRSSTFRLL